MHLTFILVAYKYFYNSDSDKYIMLFILGAHSSVVSCPMREAGRLRFRFLIRSLDFFNWPNPSSRTMALGSTQPLTEMSTGNLPGGKGRQARKADNLTAICKPIVYKMWKPRRLTTLWASKACYKDSFTFFTFILFILFGINAIFLVVFATK
jgi:hypothetical protein